MKGSMTNPISGYEIPEQMTLGMLCWYTITSPRVTHSEMVDLVADLGLDPSIMPNPPRKGDAFKRACRYSEQNGLLIPGSPNKANILIRSVAATATDVERHLVLEIVDAEGRHLEYIVAAHLKFNRTSDKLYVSKRQMETAYDEMVMRALNIFNQNFEDAIRYIDAQVIRRMVRDQLEHMGAISVRRQGSVYFYAAKHEGMGIALEKFCKAMGPGSDFHSLPLVDTTKQREMVSAAFEGEVHERSIQILQELEAVRAKEKQITIRAWGEYKDEFTRLQENAQTYKELVATEMTKAEIELEALKDSLEDFLGSGMVKVK